MSKLREGYCIVRNPFNAKLQRRVSLRPEDLDCIVFWTRNPLPLLPHIPELEERGLSFYVQVTLTGYPDYLEPGAPRPDASLAAMAALSERIGPRRVVWRYDPIFLARGKQGDLDPGWQLSNFESLARRLEGRVERVIVSLLDEYGRTRSRLEAAGLYDLIFGSPLTREKAGRGSGDFRLEPDPGPAPRLPPEPYPGLLAGIAACAKAHALSPRACAEPWDLASLGIAPSACVDSGLASLIAGRPIAAPKDSGQRPGCGCAASVDIGSYGPCPARCAYCYARR